MTTNLGRAIRVSLLTLLVMPASAQSQTAAGMFDVCVTALTGVLYAARDGKCFHSSHTLKTLSDGSGAVKVGDAAGGDLSGSFPNPTVSKLAGRPLDASVAPASNAVLTFRDGKWTPAALPSGGVSEQRLAEAIAQVTASYTAAVDALATRTTTEIAGVRQYADEQIAAVRAASEARAAALEARVASLEATVASLAAPTSLRSPGGRYIVEATNNGIVLRRNDLGLFVTFGDAGVEMLGNVGSQFTVDGFGALLLRSRGQIQLVGPTEVGVTANTFTVQGGQVRLGGSSCPAAAIVSDGIGGTTVRASTSVSVGCSP